MMAKELGFNARMVTAWGQPDRTCISPKTAPGSDIFASRTLSRNTSTSPCNITNIGPPVVPCWMTMPSASKLSVLCPAISFKKTDILVQCSSRQRVIHPSNTRKQIETIVCSANYIPKQINQLTGPLNRRRQQQPWACVMRLVLSSSTLHSADFRNKTC